MKKTTTTIQPVIDERLEIPKVIEPHHEKKPNITKWVLIFLAVFFLFFMLIVPMFVVVTSCFKEGLDAYKNAILDEDTISALKLTLLATVTAVVINTIFGLCAAWTVTKYNFKGKNILTTLIDLPFSISPVIAGLIFILTFGKIGWAYDIVESLGIKIVFAVPGVIIATIFVTFPFVFREVTPVLNSVGSAEEEAAALMGSGAFHTFFKVTLPHIKWALVYGIILCTARAMGEFGAVSVLSGHLRGKTCTLPLQVEILYNQFNTTAAFAVSSLLVVMAVIILLLRNFVGHKKE